MELDVAADVMPELDGERVALPRRRDPDGVGDADPVHAHLVDGLIDPQEVALGRAEAVLAREADLLPVVLDELDDPARLDDDLVDALAVREVAEERRRPEEDVDPGHAGLDGDAGVIHMTPHVRKYLCMEAQRRDHPQVFAGLRGRDRRGQLDVLDPEFVQELRDGDLVGRREVGVRELLALAERGVDDRESLDRHAVPPS